MIRGAALAVSLLVSMCGSAFALDVGETFERAETVCMAHLRAPETLQELGVTDVSQEEMRSIMVAWGILTEDMEIEVAQRLLDDFRAEHLFDRELGFPFVVYNSEVCKYNVRFVETPDSVIPTAEEWLRSGAMVLAEVRRLIADDCGVHRYVTHCGRFADGSVLERVILLTQGPANSADTSLTWRMRETCRAAPDAIELPEIDDA